MDVIFREQGIDFIFGFDASESVKKEGWLLEVNLGTALIDSLLGLGFGHRVAGYYYNTDTTEIAPGFKTDGSLTAAIEGLDYSVISSSSTNGNMSSFQKAKHIFDTNPRNGKSPQQSVHVLLSDGEPFGGTLGCGAFIIDAVSCAHTRTGVCPSGCDDTCKCAMSTANAFNEQVCPSLQDQNTVKC